MRYALVYGALAGAIVVAVIVAGFTLDLPDHAQSEWFGYLVMLVALSLIFVGVKRYRDVKCGGVIGFGRAFGVGLGTATVAGLVYVATWETYVAISGIDYMADYSASIIADMRADGVSEQAIAAKTAELNALTAKLENPLFRLPMVFAEIFPVGLIVALAAAALLRNPRVLLARSDR